MCLCGASIKEFGKKIKSVSKKILLKVFFGKFGFNLAQTKIVGRERGNMALAFQLAVDLPTLQIF